MMDVGDMADRYFAEIELALGKRPICDFCGEHIQEEYLYHIETKKVNLCLCEQCIQDCREEIDG